jgi:hypothetical protein
LSSVSSGKYQDIAINWTTAVSFHIVSNNYSLVILPFNTLYAEILIVLLYKWSDIHDKTEISVMSMETLQNLQLLVTKSQNGKCLLDKQ